MDILVMYTGDYRIGMEDIQKQHLLQLISYIDEHTDKEVVCDQLYGDKETSELKLYIGNDVVDIIYNKKPVIIDLEVNGIFVKTYKQYSNLIAKDILKETS